MTIDDVIQVANDAIIVKQADNAHVSIGIDKPKLRAAILALLAESDGPWKRVVIEKLIVSHCYKNAHEDDPESAVNDLISWEVAVALDPCVSSDAVKLLDAEAEACHAIVSEEDLRWDAMDRIRARIAARKSKEPAFTGYTIGVDPGMKDGTVVLHHAGQVVRVVILDTSTKENTK